MINLKLYKDILYYHNLIIFCFNHNIFGTVFRRIFYPGKTLNKNEFIVVADNYLQLLHEVEYENIQSVKTQKQKH